MKIVPWTGSLILSLSLALLLFGTGCGPRGQDKGNGKGDEKTAKANDKKGEEDAAHGWWCAEHGVPEEMCSLCLPEKKVKEMFKDTGDWCKEHDRALSQCFKCDPSKYAKFEAMYEANFGKKPPRPPEEEFKK